jgi:hypothetical protein
MATFIFNIALGRIAYLASLPAGNDGLVLIPMQSAGIQPDATLRQYATVAALLAGGNSEQTTMGRTVLAGVTVTVNNTDSRVEIAADDVTWTAATGAAVGDLMVAYDPDLSGGTDADLIPLSFHDFVITPSGSDVVVLITDVARAVSSA